MKSVRGPYALCAGKPERSGAQRSATRTAAQQPTRVATTTQNERTETACQTRLRPPHLAGQFMQQHPLQHFDGFPKTFVGREETVLVLDAEHAVVAGNAQCAHEVAPELLVLPVADAAERPRPLRKAPVVLRVEHAVHADVRAVEVDILGV